MEPTRILPDLQCSVLCEDIRQEMNSNFILLGVINHIVVPKLPVTALKLCIFNRWVAGIGQFAECVRLIAPDGSTMMRESRLKFQLQSPSHSATNVSVFGQIEFQQPGIYHIEVIVDDVLKLRFPVPVLEAPSNPAAPEAKPEA
ncbi:MAG: hypothetical protein EXS22_01010 [Pedosphaera sp.]|nr:hypothetical protein [Pedosphaera sp.]MSU42604.1 hypothetical protein [Pedosphaera sp.]